MDLNQKQIDAIISILEYEQAHNPDEFSLGWSWSILVLFLNSGVYMAKHCEFRLDLLAGDKAGLKVIS